MERRLRRGASLSAKTLRRGFWREHGKKFARTLEYSVSAASAGTEISGSPKEPQSNSRGDIN